MRKFMLVILTITIMLPVSLHATGSGPDPKDSLQSQIDSLKKVMNAMVASLPKGSDAKFEKIETRIKSLEALIEKLKADQQKSIADQNKAIADVLTNANSHTDEKFNEAMQNNQSILDSLKYYSRAIATLRGDNVGINDRISSLEAFKERVGNYVPWSSFLIACGIFLILLIALGVMVMVKKSKTPKSIKDDTEIRRVVKEVLLEKERLESNIKNTVRPPVEVVKPVSSAGPTSQASPA